MKNGTTYKSRGIRNNNPFNIKNTSDNWKGSLPKSEKKDKKFVEFYNIDFGIRAGVILLKNYLSMGYDTVDKIISRYAPPNENYTKNYITYVSSFVYNDGPLPFGAPIGFCGVDSLDFYHLCYAICQFESNYKLTVAHWRQLFLTFPELSKPIL